MCNQSTRNAVLALAALLHVVALATIARATPQDECLAGKTKCVANKVAGLLACHRRAQIAGDPVNPKCLQRVRDRFDGGGNPVRSCFERLKSEGTCLTTDETVSMENKIDAFVDDVLDELVNGPPTVTATPTVTPTPVPTPGAVNNRRCTGDTRTECTSNADCGSAGGTCEFWLGGTLPFSAAGVSICVTNQLAGPIGGTANVDTGASAGAWPMLSRVYNGSTLERPCPSCVGDALANDGVRGGTCDLGPNAGLSCDIDGSFTVLGDTSLDCPALPGSLVAIHDVEFTPTTATDSIVLTVDSPSCRAFGFGGPRCIGGTKDQVSGCSADSECPGGVCQTPKCACSTCNNGAAQTCSSNADCPDPDGPIGPICGGRRCLGGANAGAACTANSACPGGGLCNVPGQPSQPNLCIGDSCTPTVGNEGACAAGPIDTICSPTETFRFCTFDADCPFPGDTCEGKTRECFTDNGLISAGIDATGTADPPVGHQSDPVLASAYCLGPTGSSAVNNVVGLPGPERIAVAGHVTDNGTAATCPTTIEFQLLPGSGSAFDSGWTGLYHDAPYPTAAMVTVAVSGCTGTAPTCGECSYTGPVANGP